MRDLLSKLDTILNESALRDKEDLTAKRKALGDLESDPVAGKDPEISAAINQRKADLEKEAKSKGFEESFEIGDEFGISFSEDHEIATTIVDILEDGIVIELDDTAISILTNEGLTFLDGELVEGVAGPKSCWKGYRKVGTKPGTGKNAGKRVNDCEKISEYFQFEFPKGKDRGPRDHGTDELERREKSFRKHELAKDGRDYKDAMSPKSKSPLKGKFNIAGPKGKLPEDSVAEGHADQQRKIFKRNGQPVGEVGIDRESSPGVGQYYIKHYASGTDLSGFDSREEAVEELKHLVKQGVAEAEYQGRKVQLGKKMAGDVKKSKVYVRNPKGNVVKVNFGDKKMKIKKSNPARRKSFRARHNCANPGPRHKARYWSCRSW